MQGFDRGAFHQFLIEHRVVGFFSAPVTLKSGRRSHWYVNWRSIANDVALLDRLSDFLIAFVVEQGLCPDAFYGVPEGATKLAIISTYKWARGQKGYGPGSHCLPMGRGKPKEHGAPEDRFFVGEPAGRIVLVEDVTTTGGSLLGALDQLSTIDCTVIAAVGLTNRMERRDDGKGVAEAVAQRGISYYALSEATAFLPAVFAALAPGEAVARAVEEEFARSGMQPLLLRDI